MALLSCDFFSDVLGLSTSMLVILPQGTNRQIGMTGRAENTRFPVLYLLHGLSDDHTIWLRRTSIERYVAPLGLAVVMPRVARSYYTDMAHGLAYWTFISEELPRIAAGFFPLSQRREDTFAAGLSMGGYGAFKLALNHPGRFAAAASLSGALDPLAVTRRLDDPARNREFGDIFGDLGTLAGTGGDLYQAATTLAASGRPRPLLYQCCGTEDFLIEDNRRYRDHLREINYDVTYEESPGTHEWGYWDSRIRDVLAWLPLAPQPLG